MNTLLTLLVTCTIIVIFSIIFLHQKINKKQIFGILLIITGILLVNNFDFKNTANFFTTKNKELAAIQSPAVTPIPLREKAVVTFVYDGDTFETSDSRKIRLIGVDAPEMNYISGTPTPDCFGKEAKNVMIELLNDQLVELEKDIGDKDVYGRLLRYIYIDNVFINEFLIRQGYAKTMNIPPDTRYAPLFLEAENEAKTAKRGLWGKCN